MNDSDAEVLGQVAKAIRQFANDKITAQELMWKFTDYQYSAGFRPFRKLSHREGYR